MTFVHLHNHSEYSLLDGAARIEDMVAKAKALNMPALAITDHGVMYGVLSFYQAAKKAGIKPIIGCEVYVAARSRFDKEARRDDAAYHLVLLAENQQGYKNLCRLVSLGFLEGFYYKPRVDAELLKEYSEGLICLSACIAGELPELLLQNRREDAVKLALEYQQIFGKENYFIEIQNHGIPEELEVLPQLVELAKELDIPLVATNDLHYVEKKDAKMHDILLCIQTGKFRDEENRMRFYSDEFNLKTREEMEALFGQWPEALDNTLKIAERCQVEFEFGHLYLPDYDVPAGYDLDSYLVHLCREGAKKRYPQGGTEVEERLEFELSTIGKMGFSGYFLIVWDMIKHAREEGISVGPGRGSAAGSIVAYVLGITNIDPLRYNLLFERFLNPERVSPPDIDIDICDDRRGEVVDYLFNKYGYDKVSQIITFSVMAAKGAVRDVGRVLNMPYAEVDAVAKLIPFDPKFSLKDVRVKGNAPELYELYHSNPAIQELLDIAAQIQGMPRHAGKHAAGVVIAREELISYMPVQKLADGIVTTQFEKQQVEDCGLLKMDILGLRTLSVIDNALENIRHSQGEEIDIEAIPLDDAATFEMLSKGDAIGIFQLESEGMRKILRNLRPERFEDIIAVVALYRPGPLGSGMVDNFISNKHGETKVTYMHPLLENILKETYGVILYQEQVMEIAYRLAGFSLGQSDMLRRAMGKKQPEVLAKERQHFLEGCAKNNIDAKVAGDVFDLMEFFSGYGFNKSHSAAYGLVTYQTAWLKANYPKEFMAAMLTSVMDNMDKIPEYIEECQCMDIQVLPPDINESHVNFRVVQGKIRFALAGVKNVGREAVVRLVEEREEGGPFKSLEDLCCRLPLNRKAVESLIKCGCFDSLGLRRSQLLEALERALEMGRKLHADKESAQLSLFDFGMAHSEDSQPDLALKDLPEYPTAQLLAMEKEVIGFYISGHPLDSYGKYFGNKATHNSANLAEALPGDEVKIGGQISALRQLITRNGADMAVFTLEDQYGSIRCLSFPKNYPQVREFLLPGKVILAHGRVKIEEGVPELVLESVTAPFRIYLRLPDSNDKAQIDGLCEALMPHIGDGALSVYYADLKQYFPLPGVPGLNPDQKLLAQLGEELGQENIAIR